MVVMPGTFCQNPFKYRCEDLSVIFTAENKFCVSAYFNGFTVKLIYSDPLNKPVAFCRLGLSTRPSA